MKLQLNEDLARKVIETVDKGLSCGLGKRKPGEMCIEAAVCFAYGLPHGDNPPCVGSAVRRYKIALNDKLWSFPEARAKGMRALAIAQLGSDILDQDEFVKQLTKATIQKVLPKLFRDLAQRPIFASYINTFNSVASRCEVEGTIYAAVDAETVVDQTIALGYHTYATHTTIRAATYAAALASRYAAQAIDGTHAADAADAAATAIYAAADPHVPVFGGSRYTVARWTSGTLRDSWLSFSADICLEVLKNMNSPGCQYLYLLDK